MDCQIRKVVLAFAFLACCDFIATDFAPRADLPTDTAPSPERHLKAGRHLEISAKEDRAALVPDI